MFMGGEIYLSGYEAAWAIGRELAIPVACHIVGTFGMRDEFDKLAANNAFTSDNLFVHMTGMSDFAWQKVRDAGAAVSLAVPIEMNMRHGTPPILKAMKMGIEFSLSTDVECTLTADFFTQMRAAMSLQRMFVNGRALGETDLPDTTGVPLAKVRDALRWATINGARDLKLDRKVGTLTPGKEADLLILDAEAINVAPLNHVPGAVVTLMDRTNVETVMVAGRIRKWKGKLVDVNLGKLRREIEASRDYVLAQAGIQKDLFRA
jgi:cytosine/adenosine deaminase-related metal-dependent hydrolase